MRTCGAGVVVVDEVNGLSSAGLCQRKTLFTRRRFLSSVSLADSGGPHCTPIDGWMAGREAAWMDKNSVVSRQAGSAAAAVLVVDGKLSISGRISVCDFFSFVVVVTCDALLSHQLRPYSLSRSLLPAT